MNPVPLCRLLGIRVPILQGGMGPYSTTRLAAAVSEAGALGVVSHPAIDTLTPDERIGRMREAVRRVAAGTRGVFGANVRVAPEYPEAPALIAALARLRREDAALAARFRVLVTSAGAPGPHARTIRDAGFVHGHVVPSAYHARKAAAAGVDFVVASGHEGGGHVGHEPVHTVVLVPAVVAAVSLPVVAGGGIADGRGLAAALALGAQAVQMGTRFLASEEAEFHANYKRAVVRASERDTVVTRGVAGNIRYLRNAYAAGLAALVDRGAPEEEIERFRGDYNRRRVLAVEEGDVEQGAMPGGEAAGLIEAVLPAREIVERTLAEARAAVAVAGARLAGDGPWTFPAGTVE